MSRKESTSYPSLFSHGPQVLLMLLPKYFLTLVPLSCPESRSIFRLVFQASHAVVSSLVSSAPPPCPHQSLLGSTVGCPNGEGLELCSHTPALTAFFFHFPPCLTSIKLPLASKIQLMCHLYESFSDPKLSTAPPHTVLCVIVQALPLGVPGDDPFIIMHNAWHSAQFTGALGKCLLNLTVLNNHLL